MEELSELQVVVHATCSVASKRSSPGKLYPSGREVANRTRTEGTVDCSGARNPHDSGNRREGHGVSSLSAGLCACVVTDVGARASARLRRTRTSALEKKKAPAVLQNQEQR